MNNFCSFYHCGTSKPKHINFEESKTSILVLGQCQRHFYGVTTR